MDLKKLNKNKIVDMPRNRSFSTRQISADYKYECIVLAKFINYTMKHGRKHTARKIVYTSLDILAKHATDEQTNIQMFRQAIKKVSPSIQLKSRRMGGATYQVPMQVTPSRSQFLGSNWILWSARNRKEHTMSERLANEIMDVLKGKGASYKRKEEMEKSVAANRSFAHLR